jgi:hypothetical protein
MDTRAKHIPKGMSIYQNPQEKAEKGKKSLAHKNCWDIIHPDNQQNCGIMLTILKAPKLNIWFNRD